MKHNLKIILLLVFLFFSAQIIGLYITKYYLTNKLPYNIERPEIPEKTSFIYIFAIIILMTFVAILLMRLNLAKLWKIWFFLAVIFCLTISFSIFIKQFPALILAILAAFYKIIKRNVIIHNLTELFIYGALAAIFVPILNILSISILLILISIYDFIAVWKTKHMIKLAKFQTKLRLFAGLFIPYGKNKAILGGGDIGFPLLFTGVLLKSYGNKAFIVPIFVTIALFILLTKTKKKKFYPAMPFLTIGCFTGYLFLILF